MQHTHKASQLCVSSHSFPSFFLLFGYFQVSLGSGTKRTNKTYSAELYIQSNLSLYLATLVPRKSSSSPWSCQCYNVHFNPDAVCLAQIVLLRRSSKHDNSYSNVRGEVGHRQVCPRILITSTVSQRTNRSWIFALWWQKYGLSSSWLKVLWFCFGKLESFMLLRRSNSCSLPPVSEETSIFCTLSWKCTGACTGLMLTR